MLDQVVRVPVARRTGSRHRRGALAALLFIGLLAAGAITAVVILAIALIDEPSFGRMVFLAFGVLIAAIFGTFAYLAWRQYREAADTAAAGELEIRGDRMTLDYPSVFHEPVTFDAEDIAAIAVDSRGPHLPGLHWHRFPVRGSAGTAGCLWRRNLPSPIAIAAPRRDRPNLLIAFTQPRRFPSATGAGWVGDAVAAVTRDGLNERTSEELPGARPLDTAGLHHALFVSVEDADTALRALRSWSAFRDELSVEDVAAVRLLPVPGRARTAVGLGVWSYVVLAVALVAASVAGLINVNLWTLLVVPPAVALEAYLLYRGLPALRSGFMQRPPREKLSAIFGLVLGTIMGVFAVVGVIQDGQLQDDSPQRVPTVPSPPVIPPVVIPPGPELPAPTFPTPFAD